MGRRKDHSLEIKERVIMLTKLRLSYRKIAQILNISASSCCKIWKENASSGLKKPRATFQKKSRYSERTLRNLLRKIKCNPFASSSDLKKELELYGIFYSAGHIRRILREKFNLNGFRAAKKPLLTSYMRRKRLEFAKKYAAFSLEDWSKVLFSDETMIRQFHNRVIVRRPPHTRYLQRYVLKTVKHPISIMIWGCISRYGRSPLKIYENGVHVNGEIYERLLRERLQSDMLQHQADIFMHDNAPCHRASIVSRFFQEENIQVLDWPGNSPDINPIENAWFILKRKVGQMLPMGKDDLVRKISLAWESVITPEYCEKLVMSMPDRIGQVIKNRGGPTNY